MWLALLTAEYGRVNAIRRGASREAALWVPFQPIVLSLRGQGDLQTVTRAEPAGPGLRLSGAGLYAGFYINELFYRLLPPAAADSLLFSRFSSSLQQLAACTENDLTLQCVLRALEQALLSELGFDPRPPQTAAEGTASLSFDPRNGEWRAQPGKDAGLIGPVEPALLAGLATACWQQEGVAALARRIHRERIKALLGQRPLHSRRLFQQYLEVKNGASTAARCEH